MGALVKFLKSIQQFTVNSEQTQDATQEVKLSEDQPSTSTSTTTKHNSAKLQTQDATQKEVFSEDQPSTSTSTTTEPNSTKLNIFEISNWPDPMTDKLRIEFLKHKLKSDKINTSSAEKGKKYFYRLLPNGEIVYRKWLIQSEITNKLYCFVCKLFNNRTQSNALMNGLNDWKHVGDRLKEHETSQRHYECIMKMNLLINGMEHENLINQTCIKIQNKEIEKLKNVLKRVVEIILFLTSRNLAFRGNSDKLYEPQNGNFLGLIELLAKFDIVLNEHINSFINKTSRKLLLNHAFQNEIICALASKVRKTLINKIKRAKYYSVILDCTPDISHLEQMSIIIRIVDIQGENVEIVEHFINFIVVSDTTGYGLTQSIKNEFIKQDLLLSNCRGQSYDNGSNMKGKNRGVQALIREENPRAFYLPCTSHNLNLILGDCCKSSERAINFFSLIQKIFTTLSGSVIRWNIFKTHAPLLTPKPLSETRWECRLESIKAIRLQFPGVITALEEVATVVASVLKVEVLSIINNIKSFEFVMSLVIWYEILNKVNITSKISQKRGIQISVVLEHLKQLIIFFKSYRNSGFEEAIISSGEICSSVNISPEFRTKRISKKTKMYTYENNDDIGNDAKQLFKVDYFLKIVDCAIVALDERFEQYSCYNDMFGFLHNIGNLKSKSDEELKQHCNDLHLFLKDGENADIDGDNLFHELKFLSQIIEENTSPLDCLKKICKDNIDDVYPNTYIALRIMLTTPVSVASAERSFSKLKLIKNYLRSTMRQDRLDGVAMLSIEQEVTKQINFDDIIEELSIKTICTK